MLYQCKSLVFKLLVCLGGLFVLDGARAATPDSRYPPQAHYLFYLHGLDVETHGARGAPEQYPAIVEAFSKQGLWVLSEVRPAGTPSRPYGRRVAGQVRYLLDAGVPPEHITLVGYSKGGLILLEVLKQLGEPRVKAVTLAGCWREGAQYYAASLAEYGAALSGRILSIEDARDSVMGSCRALAERSLSAGRSVRFSDIHLQTGRGHRAFAEPLADWVNPVVQFALAD